MKKSNITSTLNNQTRNTMIKSSAATTSKVAEQQTTHDPALSRSFRGHEDLITCADFDPNMRQVASSSKDSIVYVWNFKPQQRPFKFVGHKGPVYCVKYSPDGETIASCGQDRQIRLWQNTVQSKCSVIKAHCGSIRSINFSNDGAYLLSSSDDKTLKLWRLQDKKFLYSLSGHKNWVRSGVISPDMRLISSASDDKTVKLWDFNSQALINTYNDHTDTVSQVLFHPDGTCLISSSFDQKIKIVDIRSNRLIQHYNAHDAAVNSISVHPSGYYLASSGSDSKIKVWDLRQGRQVYTLYSNDKDITTVNFNQSGDYFVTGGTQNLCMVWKTNFDASIQNIEQVKNSSSSKQNNVEYSTGGLYTSTLFKTNKTAAKSPSKAQAQLQIIPPEQFQDTFNRNEDELNNARVYENKQSSSPTFSQQQQQLQGIQQLNEFQPQSKSQNESLVSHKNAPFHPSIDYQQSSQQLQKQPLNNGVNVSSGNYQNNFVPKVEDENVMTEAIAASMQQMYSRLDQMFQLMNSLDSRVALQETMQKSFLNQSNQNTLVQDYTQTLDPKTQTMNFGYAGNHSRIDDQSLSNSLNDRNVVNIFQTGALANTGSIEACLLNKQQIE